MPQSFTSHNEQGPLPDRESTPPAALSSLGLKLRAAQQAANDIEMAAEHHDAAATAAFSDSQYDMLDDLSEISASDAAGTEGAETASIACTEDGNPGDGSITPEEDESVVDEHEDCTAAHTSDNTMSISPVSEPEEPDYDFEPSGSREDFSKPTCEDGSDDVDTPRQSMISKPDPKRSNAALYIKTCARRIMRIIFGPHTSIVLAVTLAVALLSLWLSMPVLTPVEKLALRREALSSALVENMNASSVDISKVYNLDHLLCSSSENELAGNNTARVHYQGISPNLLVVSLDTLPQTFRFPQAAEVKVHKNNQPIDFNNTKLIEGIYQLSVDPQHAYGTVTFDILTKSPALNITIHHNFGGSMLHRSTYERALSKNVEIAKRVRAEVEPSYRATRTATKGLAVQVIKDVQIFSATAFSFLGNATRSGMDKAGSVRKDMILVKNDVLKLGTNMQDGVRSRIKFLKDRVPSSKTLTAPLLISQQRALQLRDGLRDSAKSSFCKHFKRREGGFRKRFADVKQVARCSIQTGNLRVCKEMVDAKNKATNTVSAVSGFDAVAEFYESSPPKQKSRATKHKAKSSKQSKRTRSSASSKDNKRDAKTATNGPSKGRT